MSRSGVCVLLLSGLFAAIASAQQGGTGLKPGVKRVCVPASDGRTWNCGTSDNPPEAHPLAPPPDAPPPPPFLMDPSRAGMSAPSSAPVAEQPAEPQRPLPDEFPSAPERSDTAAAGAEAPEPVAAEAETAAAAEPEPAPQAEPEPQPEPAPVAAGTESAAADESAAPPPFLAAPGGRDASPGPLAPEAAAPAQPPVEAAPEPAGASEPAAPVAEAPVAEAPVAETPLPEPPPEAAAPAPQPDDARYAGTPPLSAADFLLLAPGGHTAQLAHAATPDGFPALIAALGIAADTTYALPLPRDGKPWWVLVWSSFPDSDSARTAVLALPQVPGLNVGWPRRISLIQSELRANAR